MAGTSEMVRTSYMVEPVELHSLPYALDFSHSSYTGEDDICGGLSSVSEGYDDIKVSHWCSLWMLLMNPRLNLRTSSPLHRAEISRSTNLLPKFYYWGIKDLLFTLLWICCGWFFCGLYWGIIAMWDYSTSRKLIASPINEPTPSPTYFHRGIFQGRGPAFLLNCLQWGFRAFCLMPMCYTIILYYCTSLNTIHDTRRCRKMTIIYISNMIVSTVIVLNYLAELRKIMRLSLVILGWILIIIVWKMLVRFLHIEWRLNKRFLPAFVLCCSAGYILAGIPLLVEEELLSDITVFIPLLMMLLEYIYRKLINCLFDDEFRSNDVGITISASILLFPLELYRCVSFILLYLQFLRRKQFEDLALNVFFSLLREIYSHTQAWKVFQNWISIRLYGQRFNDFDDLHERFSAVRYHLEYVAPVIFFANVVLASACRDFVPIINEKWEFIYNEGNGMLMEEMFQIVVAYYVIEFTSEVLCWAIRKLSSYESQSAIGSFKFTDLLLMIAVTGTQIDCPRLTTGFLLMLKH
jgi:hypothetical protein